MMKTQKGQTMNKTRSSYGFGQWRKYLRRSNQVALEKCTLRSEYEYYNTLLVKISPMIEKKRRGHSGRPLKVILDTPQKRQQALQKIEAYLQIRGIPADEIHFRPAYYPDPTQGEAIFVIIRNDDNRYASQLRLQCTRNGLHFYQESISTIPPKPAN